MKPQLGGGGGGGGHALIWPEILRVWASEQGGIQGLKS